MEVNPKTKEAYQLLQDGILALARAERQGVRIDMEGLEVKKAHMLRKIERLEKKFRETDFFKEWQASTNEEVNPNSLPQLGTFLYDVKKIEPAKLTAGGKEGLNKKGSTDEEGLKQLNIPTLAYYSEKTRYKKAHDVLSGFERETVDGVIHPFYNLHTVRTFRSSSNSPNWQNIPVRDEEIAKICRGIIYPRKGHILLESDFKSVEVGVSTCYNKDPQLIKYVSNSKKNDMHRDMAQQIFMLDKFDGDIKAHKFLRKATKNGFVFPQFYGDYYKNNAVSLAVEWCGLGKGKWKQHQGIDMVQGFDPPLAKFNLSDHLAKKGIKSFDAFVEHLKKIEDHFWNKRFPVYKKWKEDTYNTFLKTGYVDLYTGFRCFGPMSKNDATNYPVQGAAFHCLLKCFIEIDRIATKEKWKTKLIGQIHDSMILDVYPLEFNHVVKTIHNVTSVWLPKQFPWIIVPISVEMEATGIDQPWSSKKEIEI